MQNPAPTCPNCRALLPGSFLNIGRFASCPGCEAKLWAEAFPALNRPVARGSSGEAVLVPGESTCFYHDAKKAAAVCDVCGRFLCALCDCLLHGGHYCPNCLQTGKQKGKTLRNFDNMRLLYGRQAFVLSLVPLYFTGVIAVYMALRYRKEPGSLVSPRKWMYTAALIFGSIQTVVFTLLIVMAIIR